MSHLRTSPTTLLSKSSTLYIKPQKWILITMKAVRGNNLETLSFPLKQVLKDFESVNVDIGTGDGRYVYKKASENPRKYYIGVDPSQKQLSVYSKKAVKNKLNNCMFVIGSIEVIPIKAPQIIPIP